MKKWFWDRISCRFSIILLISVFLIFLFSYASAYTIVFPNGTVTNITILTPMSDQNEPAISGEWIVWVDNRDSQSHLWSWDLHLYNIVSGNESIVRSPDDITEPFSPRISGNRIVWQSPNTSTTYDIRMYDTLNEEYRIIATNIPVFPSLGVGPQPDISGNNIVWQTLNGSAYDIWMYDVSTQIATPIAGNISETFNPPNPKISGNRIVWQTYDGFTYTYTIYIHNISETPHPVVTEIYDPPMVDIDNDTLVWQSLNLTQFDYYYDIFYIPDISINADPVLIASDVPYYYPMPDPKISNGKIVWQDWRNNNLDIYLYDISQDELKQISTDLNEESDPEISGDRIVWVENGPYADIFLYTLDVSETCPVAAFDADAIIGGAPFPVQFTDTSDPAPQTWTWEFGDGNTSRDQNPDYTYPNQGTYSVDLTVSTPYCRDGIAMPDLIHVGTPPVAAFSGSLVSGFAPLEVSFSDESSGSPIEWLWDFGDGFVSTAQNPNHTFSSGGSYNVTLLVNNSFGTDTITKANYVSVLERTGSVVSTSIDGLNVASNQSAIFDSSRFSSYALTDSNTTLWFIPPPENGISEMTLFADGGFTDAGGIITGNLTGVSFRSEDIPLTGFSPAIGTGCSISYLLNSSAYPSDAQIAIAKWEGYISSDYDYFLQTIYHAGFAGIVGVAYEVQFQKTNLNVPHNATLYLSVNSSWVEAHGTKNRTWVLRIGDDMTGEVLPTTFSHTNVTENLDYFVADSPHGLSKFALTGLHGTGNPLQIIVLIVQQLFHIDSDSSDAGVPTPTPSPTPSPTPTTSPVPTTPVPSGGMGYPTSDGEGVLTDPIEIQSEDRFGTILISTGTKALQKDGSRLSNLSIRRLNTNEVPYIPSGESFEGIAYELLPDGATFDPPLVFSLTIPDEKWSGSKGYSLQWYNRTSERWEAISTTFNAGTRTLTVRLEHFSVIGLFSYDLPTTTTTAAPTTSPPVTTTPVSPLIGLLAVGAGMIWLARGRR